MAESRAPAKFIEDIPATLLDTPLDFVFADHFRQRTLCNLLTKLADADAADPGMAGAVLSYLRTDLPLHVLDEEEDLFPLMRRRCAPEDEVERILSLLEAEHGNDERLAADILEALPAIADAAGPVPLPDRLADLLLQFAIDQRRHLVYENSVLLPIARRRLTESDLENLSRRMKARRARKAQLRIVEGPG